LTIPTLSPPQTDIEVILLAAGRSTRMGATDKLLLPIPARGGGGGPEPMIRHTARLYRELGLPITAVVPDLDGPVAIALTGLDIRLVANPWAPQSTPDDDGQQASLRAGLAAAPLAAKGVLVALGDMPWLTAADITALIACFEAAGAARICIPRHAGQRGNPVLFPSPVLRALRDDPSAPSPRAFIASHAELVHWHETASDHFIRDIDIPADAATLTNSGAQPS
jgi:molybdenum cofactor cytidylyltransferase